MYGARDRARTRADLAIKMGCPIYGIVGLANTATDKEGRSVPAPGQGILTTAREVRHGEPGGGAPRVLAISYRRRWLERALRHVDEGREDELEILQDASEKQSSPEIWLAAEIRRLDEECARSKRALRDQWGNRFYEGNDSIAPLRGALAVWGLGVDDIAVASFHGTSTKLNDLNESEVTQKQMEHLGRSEGNPLLVVAQKWLTGHPKGAAAAWMMNGLLQILTTGLIPGNRNADDIEPKLRKNHHLFYPQHSVQTDGVNAAIMKSFGFGQAGAELLIVHPKYLLGAMDPAQRAAYVVRRAERETRAFHRHQEILLGRRNYVEVKTSAPYSKEDEQAVYLDPSARAKWNPDQGRFLIRPTQRRGSPAESGGRSNGGSNGGSGKVGASSLSSVENRRRSFSDDVTSSGASVSAAPPASPARSSRDKKPSAPSPRSRLEVTMRRQGKNMISNDAMERGLGVDVEAIATFQTPSETFLRRNFTAAEIAYCQAAPNSAASFAGRWSAKEAVVKALSNYSLDADNLWQGAGAPLIDIEISKSSSGAPEVTLHGHPLSIAQVLGVSSIKVSISHTDDITIAQAFAT